MQQSVQDALVNDGVRHHYSQNMSIFGHNLRCNIPTFVSSIPGPHIYIGNSLLWVIEEY